MSSKRPKGLIEQVREAIRLRHYSIRTEDAYVHWIIKFILYHDKRHPKEMGIQEIEGFLTHLAVREHAASRKTWKDVSTAIIHTQCPGEALWGAGHWMRMACPYSIKGWRRYNGNGCSVLVPLSSF